MIPIVTNPCGCPHCREPMCNDIDWMCPCFKPRLLGFIPVSRKFGERLMMYQERKFRKKYVKYYGEPPIDGWEGDFDG